MLLPNANLPLPPCQGYVTEYIWQCQDQTNYPTNDPRTIIERGRGGIISRHWTRVNTGGVQRRSYDDGEGTDWRIGEGIH